MAGAKKRWWRSLLKREFNLLPLVSIFSEQKQPPSLASVFFNRASRNEGKAVSTSFPSEPPTSFDGTMLRLVPKPISDKFMIDRSEHNQQSCFLTAS